MSEIWKRKMITGFRAIDLDKDGVISRKDFNRLNEGWVVAAKKDDPVQQEKLRKVNDDLWLKITSSTKTNEKELLTEAMFVDSIMKQKNDPKQQGTIRDACLAFFQSMDTNKDGYVNLSEFRNGFGSLGIPDTSFAEQSFKFIDTNHDGKISFDEYARVFLEFMFSENEDSPYNLFWGPLE